jgi:hypothetical protein
MKKNRYFFLLLFLAFGFFAATAQNQPDYSLLLHSGKVSFPENLQEFLLRKSIPPASVAEGKFFRFVQFYEIPSQEAKDGLNAQGIELLDYIPNFTYMAAFSADYNASALRNANIRGINEIKPEHKLFVDLAQKNYPEWALRGKNEIELNVLYYRNISNAFALANLLKVKGAVLVDNYSFSQRITIRVPISEIQKIASLPFVSYVEPIDPPADPENLPGRTNHRSNTIATEYASGRNYDGSGVKIAMGDDGIIGPHIDFQGRADQSRVSANNGDHGDHVAGTIMGAGNLNPTTRGMAFGSELHVYSVWNAIYDTPTSYTNPGIRFTSLSYGNGCNAGYTSFARTADQQLRQMPSLMHVFSAGNSGTENCNYGAGSGWGNITGGVKVGKNVIAVGNLSSTDALANSSSRGPAHDGRIKPDVCAVGTSVLSTVDVNTYAVKSGTSMACPGVTGTMAQLFQAYKELNQGQEPNAGLLKGILMNSADDLGNPGPDFRFGYGRINALRAVRTIEENRFINGQITNGGSQTHNIAVPTGTRQVNIMVYWTDFEAAANAAKALVNDLNMKVIAPNSAEFLPWVLNHSPNSTALNSNAVRGVDNLNNVEQVTIQDPLAGNYQVTIQGFQVPQGPQQYYVIYEFITDEIALTYPIGGESFVPGSAETIRWDAFGNSGNFTLQYSSNGGSTWTNISTSVSGSLRYFTWTPPSIVSGEVLIRISRGSQTSMSQAPFSIIGVPTGIKVEWSCPDSVKISWNAVNGATSYEVSRLGSKYMDAVATSTGLTAVVTGVSPMSPDEWFSVKAMGPTNAIGRRANAINKNAGIWNCPTPIDIAVSQILSPFGRLQICQDNSQNKVVVRLENRGITQVANVPVSFRAAGGSIFTETFTGTINPGDTAVFSFSATTSFIASGNTSFISWVSYQGDNNPYNDSASAVIQLVSGTSMNIPWAEDFELYPSCTSSLTCATNCTVANGWVKEQNGQNDDIDWRCYSGPTPTSGTGPTVDVTKGTEDGKYLYLQARECYNKTGIIISPCINIPTETHPELSFWYHMNGGSLMGRLHVDIFADGFWIEDVTPALAGPQGDEWKQMFIPLADYKGKTINVRFRGITGGNNRSDIAIDDIAINDITNIPLLALDRNLKVYPNPSKGFFNVELLGQADENARYTILDIHGRIVLSNSLKANTATGIDLTGYAKGVYILNVTSGNHIKNVRLLNL